MSQPLNIIIVERTGTLKMLAIKDFKEEELFKKCGFKKAEDFLKQTEWNVKYDSKKYYIQFFAKTDVFALIFLLSCPWPYKFCLRSKIDCP